MSGQYPARSFVPAALAVFLFLGGLLVAGRNARGDDSQTERLQALIGERNGDLESADEIRQRNLLLKQQSDAIDPEARYQMVVNEYHRLEADKARRQLSPQTGPSWTSLGPTNGAGRMTAIAPHPTLMGTLYVGSDGGGVWKTTDGGATWSVLTDTINNLNVGALALAPSSPNTVYIGTGSEHASGIGVIKSTDAGMTWGFPSGPFASRFFRISVNPSNPDELVAGVLEGGFRSTDGGATWANVIAFNTFGATTDIVRDPSSPQIVYATTGFSSQVAQVLKSTDGGTTWAIKTTGLPTAGVHLYSLAISPSSPQTLYIAGEVAVGFNPVLDHVFKSTDGGDSWNDLPAISTDPSFNRYTRGQGFHDNTIVVSPLDSNTVIAGGVGYIRTTDGGTTWSGPPFSPDIPHADAADLKYQGSTLYIANDGGIWSTPDNGNTATNHNTGIVTREYYSISNDPVTKRIMAGSQDNGTDVRPSTGGTVWNGIQLGDNFHVAINPYSPSIAYTTIFGLGAPIVRTKDLSDSNPFLQFEDVTPVTPPGEILRSMNQFAMDPGHPSTIFTASGRLWRSTDGGDNWAPLPTTTTDGSTWGTVQDINAIAVAPGNSSIILVGRFFNPPIFHSSDGGTTWAAANSSNLATVNQFDIDPRNSNVAFAAQNPGGVAAIIMTTDGGATWVPRASGIPPLFEIAWTVRIDPNNPSTIYCGTDFGVYRSTDQGASWSRFGTGLPSIQIRDLEILPDSSAIRVATYGRGVWELQLPASDTPPVAMITNPASTINVTKGASVVFQGSVTDPDAGDSATGFWAFPDTGQILLAGTGSVSTTHVFNRAGSFPITLTARDNNNALGSSTVTINVDEPFDDCATSLVIPGAGPFPFSVSANNEAATTQGTDPSQCVGNSSTLWFEFTPTASDTYQFTVPKKPFNGGEFVAAFTGPACGPYSPLSCAFGTIVVQATAGTTLRIVVDGIGAPFTLIVTNSSSPTCSFGVASPGQSFTRLGGSASVDVTTNASCSWTATSNAGWISVYAGSSHTGSGTVFYSVQPNSSPRSGTITIAGQDFTVTQTGSPDTIGLYTASSGGFAQRFSNTAGSPDNSFFYGPPNAGWIPLAGDWNGDGVVTPGLYDPVNGLFFLRNSSTTGTADITFAYGPPNIGWIPIIGDWDGNGTDTVGLYDPIDSIFFLRNSNTTGVADITFAYGPGSLGWIPIAGDWNGTGTDTIGLFDPSRSLFFLRNSNTTGVADTTFAFGPANSGWTAIVGDWDANGTDTVGFFNPTTSRWFLKNANTTGTADLTFIFGSGGTPLTGRWQ